MANLHIQQISKSFGEQKVIDQLTFHVQNGEFVSILGPSGSGKSTLFQMIGGNLMPTNGSITLGKEDITGKKGLISYMPQSPSLFPWRTILQNVMLGAEIAGQANEKRALDMIERAGLKGYEHAYPHELSGGMKQRASFIRSLLSPQSIMCLDEPFSALDEFTRLDMQKWLLSMWEDDQRSILFITHHIEEAIFLSDRILVLSDKPATLKKEWTVPFSRPRRDELPLTDAFIQLKREIYAELRNKNATNH